MHFAEAEEKYRELEQKLIDGELLEEGFLRQVDQFRLVDKEGRRWRLSGSTGRWLMHDGQQWVFGEPPEEAAEVEFEDLLGLGAESADEASLGGDPTLLTTASATQVASRQQAGPQHLAPRLMAVGVVALVFLCCVLGGGVSAWVLFLRDMDEGSPDVSGAPEVGFVATYTPRAATATYTPTFTPTPSRTPTPSITPVRTDTPVPTPTNTGPPPTATNTPPPSDTPPPTGTPRDTDTPSPPPPQTYTVKQGETLSEIASRFGVGIDTLAEANGIINPALVSIGQILVIPPAGGLPTATWTPIALITPTWTPIVLSTPIAMNSPTPRPTSVPTSSPIPTTAARTPTPTKAGPTPTKKPQPTKTPKPASVTGKIAFALWNPALNKFELFVSLINGTGRNLLGQGFRQPQFRPDGNLLAVNGEGAPNYEHLVTMNPSGQGWTEVSSHTEDSFPTWRSDGGTVAFSSSSWGDGRTRLGTVKDMTTKFTDWIPAGSAQVEGHYPFWMADGRLVYHGCDSLGSGGNCGLYWVGAGGGAYHLITDHNSDTAPAGHGSNIAFMSARDGNWEIYRKGIDGGALQRLTNNGASDGLPTWSPDGKSIAFVSNRGGPWAIWVMNANGSNQRKLFDLGGGYGSGTNAFEMERISWAP